MANGGKEERRKQREQYGTEDEPSIIKKGRNVKKNLRNPRSAEKLYQKKRIIRSFRGTQHRIYFCDAKKGEKATCAKTCGVVHIIFSSSRIVYCEAEDKTKMNPGQKSLRTQKKHRNSEREHF